MISKRAFIVGAGSLICLPGARPARAALPPIPMERHEQAMRAAIEMGKKNPYFPFGAVMTEASTGDIVARGTNDAHANPTLHGEIVCMKDYIARHGNKDWESKILYTTCEPCTMCISALIWARIGGVVFATSLEGQRRAGMEPFKITARDVIESENFHKPMLLGGVLAAETDRMFLDRKRY
jgi:tRNA(Arg) A34 adenosine deaminase TadA